MCSACKRGHMSCQEMLSRLSESLNFIINQKAGPNPLKQVGRVRGGGGCEGVGVYFWGCVFDFSLAYETCEEQKQELLHCTPTPQWQAERGHDKTLATTKTSRRRTQINCIKMLYTPHGDDSPKIPSGSPLIANSIESVARNPSPSPSFGSCKMQKICFVK